MHVSFSKTTDGNPFLSDVRENQKKQGGVCFGGSVAHLRTEPQSSGQMSLGFLALLAHATLQGTRRCTAMLGMQSWSAGIGGV
jgi:hypothetical protein